MAKLLVTYEITLPDSIDIEVGPPAIEEAPNPPSVRKVSSS
jgi:hypothetical protein